MKNIEENEITVNSNKIDEPAAQTQSPELVISSSQQQQTDVTSKTPPALNQVKSSLSITVTDQPTTKKSYKLTSTANMKLEDLTNKFEKKLNISTNTANSSSGANFHSISQSEKYQEFVQDIVDNNECLSSDLNLVDYNNNEELPINNNSQNDPGYADGLSRHLFTTAC